MCERPAAQSGCPRRPQRRTRSSARGLGRYAGGGGATGVRCPPQLARPLGARSPRAGGGTWHVVRGVGLGARCCLQRRVSAAQLAATGEVPPGRRDFGPYARGAAACAGCCRRPRFRCRLGEPPSAKCLRGGGIWHVHRWRGARRVSVVRAQLARPPGGAESRAGGGTWHVVRGVGLGARCCLQRRVSAAQLAAPGEAPLGRRILARTARGAGPRVRRRRAALIRCRRSPPGLEVPPGPGDLAHAPRLPGCGFGPHTRRRPGTLAAAPPPPAASCPVWRPRAPTRGTVCGAAGAGRVRSVVNIHRPTARARWCVSIAGRSTVDNTARSVGTWQTMPVRLATLRATSR